MVAFNPLDDAELLALIRYEARALAPKLPTGYDRDDLESVAGEAVVEHFARADRSDPHRFKASLRICIRNRMKSFLASLRVKGRACSRLPQGEDGETLPVADQRSADPSDRAAAREVLTNGVLLPAPDRIAARVRVLRETVVGSIRRRDIRAAMHALGEKAAAGDAKALNALLDLIGRPEVPVASSPATQVIVHAGDF